MDDIELLESEAEFQEDMDRLRHLSGEIFLTMASHPEAVRAAWDDISTFGNEPVFASMLFDRMVIEDEHNSR